MSNAFNKVTQNYSQARDSLMKATEEISKSLMTQQTYDKTEICIIVDDSKANEGVYIVDLDGLTFEVYGEINLYKKDQSVRVSISNNDYTNKKFIIGLYDYSDIKNLYYNTSGKNLVPLYNCQIKDFATTSHKLSVKMLEATVYKIELGETISSNGGLIILQSYNSDYGHLDKILNKDKSILYLINYYPERFNNFPEWAIIDLYIGAKKIDVNARNIIRLGKVIEIQNVPLEVSRNETVTSLIINNKEINISQQVGYKDDLTFLFYRKDNEIFKDAVFLGSIKIGDKQYNIGEYYWTSKKSFPKTSKKDLVFTDETIKNYNIDLNVDKDGLVPFKDVLLSLKVQGKIHSADEFILYLKVQDGFSITEHPLVIKGSMLFGVLEGNSNYRNYDLPTWIYQLITIPSYIKGKLLSITMYVNGISRINDLFNILDIKCQIGYSLLNQKKKLHIWTDDEKLSWNNKNINMNMMWLNQNEKNQYIGFSDGNIESFDYVDTFSSKMSINNGYAFLVKTLPNSFRQPQGNLYFGYELQMWSATGTTVSYTVRNVGTSPVYDHFYSILKQKEESLENLNTIIICYNNDNNTVEYESEVTLTDIRTSEQAISFKFNVPKIIQASSLSYFLLGEFAINLKYTYSDNYDLNQVFVLTGDYESGENITGYAKFSLPYYSYDEQEYLNQYQDAETLKSYIQQVQDPINDEKIKIKLLSDDKDYYSITKNDTSLRFCLGFQTLFERLGVHAVGEKGSPDGKLIDQYFYIMYLLKNRPNQNVVLETEKRINGGELIPQLIYLFGIWSDIVYNINGVRDYINNRSANHNVTSGFLYSLEHYRAGSSLLKEIYENIKNILTIADSEKSSDGLSFPDLDFYSQSGIKEKNDNNTNKKYYLNTCWSIRECLIQSSKILNLIRVYTRVFSRMEDLESYQKVHPCIEKYLISLNETINIIDNIWQIKEKDYGYMNDYYTDTIWEEYTPDIRYIEQFDKLRFLNNAEKYAINTAVNEKGIVVQRTKSYNNNIGGELLEEYFFKEQNIIKIKINQFIKELFNEINLKGAAFSKIDNEDRDKYLISYKITLNDQTTIVKLTYLDGSFKDDDLNNPIYITCPKDYTVQSGTSVEISIYQKNFSPLNIITLRELAEDEDVNNNPFYPGYYELIMNQATEGKESYILPYLYTNDDEGNFQYSCYQLEYLDDWMQRISSTLRHCRFLIKFHKKEVTNTIFNKYLIEYENPMGGNYEITDLKNRYSLQWYLYNKDDDIDYGEGKGWKRISTISTLSQNGLEVGKEQFFNVFNYQFKDNNSHKIKAVLYYNHERYESNVIELQSYQEYLNDLNTAMNIDKQLIDSIIEVPDSSTTFRLTRDGIASSSKEVETSTEKITFQKENQMGQRVSSITANDIYLINEEGLKVPLMDSLNENGYSGGTSNIIIENSLKPAENNETGW